MTNKTIPKFLMLIDGALTGGVNDGWLTSVNPANEQEIGRFAVAEAVDVERAALAAEKAQPAWEERSMTERARLVRETCRRLSERADEILSLEVRDTGNTIGRMKNDLAAAIGLVEYYIGVAPELKGETFPSPASILRFTLREPYGVVGRIAPFNHPLYFALTGLAGPLMAGNAVVIKPPEQSPLSASILAEACRDVLPAGVVNIVNGPGAVTGQALVQNPRIRRLAFTGSVPTGLAIQRAAAEVGIKHLSLELGGKNPMIVFPDVDLDAVADAAVAGMNFAWQGQSCGATSRLILHEDIHDQVLERVIARVGHILPGDPLDERSGMGPINSRAHYDRVLQHIANASEDGAQLVIGGRRPAGREFEQGYWIEPTVFSQVKPGMRLARQEIFGPVLAVMRWRSLDELVSLANDTEYGLAASVWTRDVAGALKLSRRIKTGVFGVNSNSWHAIGVPFGGAGNSGIGREECLEELLSYTEIKSIHVAL